MTDVSTVGWDANSITSISNMNKIINGNPTLPRTFEGTGSMMGIPVGLKGEWGKIELNNDGSGARISIRLGIDSGIVFNTSMSLELDDGSKSSYVIVEVYLDGVKGDAQKWNKGEDVATVYTRCDELKIDQRRVANLVESHFTGEGMNVESWDVVAESILESWFEANVSFIDAIFSVILIGLETKNTDMKWLYPSQYSYAADSSIDQQTGAFGALTLVDGNTDIGSLQQSVDIAALNLVADHDSNLALVISKEKLVRHILLQCAIDLIEETYESDYIFSDSGLSLSNRHDVTWQNFDDGEGGKFKPIIPALGLKVTLNSDFIELSIIKAGFTPSAFTDGKMSVTQRFKFKVGKNSSGEPVFVADTDSMGDADVHCEVKILDWLKWTELGLGIVLAVTSILAFGTMIIDALQEATIATVETSEVAQSASWVCKLGPFKIPLGKLSGFAKFIVDGTKAWPTLYNQVKIASRYVSVITAIPYGAITGVDIGYAEKYDDVKSFHHIAQSFVNSALWPNLPNTVLKYACLADSFVIGLKLNEDTK